MNTKAKQYMAHGKREGIRKGAKTGTRGEYSTISGNNNVWTNSKEIKDFIKILFIVIYWGLVGVIKYSVFIGGG
jgi:hypothetical protein